MTGFNELWSLADGVTRSVALLMLLMSISAWVLILWKTWLLRRARRDLALITLEEPRFTPWDPEVGDLPEGIVAADGTSTVLAIRRWSGGICESRVLAFVHPHGRWMHWIDGHG